MRHAELKPELSSSMFPPQFRIQGQVHGHPSKTRKINVDIPNLGREDNKKNSKQGHSCADEFLDDEIDDQDLMEVGTATLSSKFCLEMLNPLS